MDRFGEVDVRVGAARLVEDMARSVAARQRRAWRLLGLLLLLRLLGLLLLLAGAFMGAGTVVAVLWVVSLLGPVRAAYLTLLLLGSALVALALYAMERAR